jgi:hypothetical protein
MSNKDAAIYSWLLAFLAIPMSGLLAPLAKSEPLFREIDAALATGSSPGDGMMRAGFAAAGVFLLMAIFFLFRLYFSGRASQFEESHRRD